VNEAVALNVAETKDFIEQNGIVAIKADKAHGQEEVDALLAKLGNHGGLIPFYAIFPASDPTRPILMEGLLTKAKVLDALKRAGPSHMSSEASGDVTAMR
jgi:thiol:disulfide interchange protein